tara:strand:+ start:1861 stop:1980 length:120 start_codon:yes stop_codon:yes gene_type:complete
MNEYTKEMHDEEVAYWELYEAGGLKELIKVIAKRLRKPQ